MNYLHIRLPSYPTILPLQHYSKHLTVYNSHFCVLKCQFIICILWLYPLFSFPGISRKMNNSSQNNMMLRGGIVLPALSEKAISQKLSSPKRNMSTKMSTKVMESLDEEMPVLSKAPVTQFIESPAEVAMFNQSASASTKVVDSSSSEEAATITTPTMNVNSGLDLKKEDGRKTDNTVQINDQVQSVGEQQSTPSLNLDDLATRNISELLSTGALIESVPTTILSGPNMIDSHGSIDNLTDPTNSSVVMVVALVPSEAKPDLLISPDLLLTSSAAWQSEKLTNWWQEEEEKKKAEGNDKQQVLQPLPEIAEGKNELQVQQPLPEESSPPQLPPQPQPKQQEEEESQKQPAQPQPTQPQPTRDVKAKPRTKMSKKDFDKYTNALIIHMIEWNRANPDAMGYPLPGTYSHRN